ncbi:MAG TPA: hypothetical protein VNT80_05675, partial [Acidimicrobiales bacterium]|nr:hypothetical protein [Acidimicrobiales bacterium]
MSDATGLRRVLERVAPAVVAENAAGTFTPSSFATPLAVASHALAHPFTLAVVATSNEAEQVRDSAAALLGPSDEVALWPGWDTHPLERVSPDNQVMATRSLLRWRLAQGTGPRVIIASARSIAQVLSPESIVAPLVVRRGSELDRDEFIASLARFGYRRESLVEHRAEFAVRGGIVDLWPAQGHDPIRLDFFGDEVERLTSFDIANQRSLHDLDQALVAPAREWLLSPDARQRAEAMIDDAPWGRSTFDRLATGQTFDGMEGWMPLFVDEPRTLLDDVVGATVVVVEPNRVQSRLAELLEEERELTDAVAATWRATEEIPLLHQDWSRVLEGRIDVALDASLAVERGPLNLTSPPIVQGDAARIAAHVRGWSTKRRGVVLTSNAAAVERMADQLRAEALEVSTDATKVLDVRITVLESSLASGFSVDDPEVVVWSESDLTGRRTVHRAARTRTRNVDGFFDDLAVGSLVVHRQHGVARFSGTTTRAI